MRDHTMRYSTVRCNTMQCDATHTTRRDTTRHDAQQHDAFRGVSGRISGFVGLRTGCVGSHFGYNRYRYRVHVQISLNHSA